MLMTGEQKQQLVFIFSDLMLLKTYILLVFIQFYAKQITVNVIRWVFKQMRPE